MSWYFITLIMLSFSLHWYIWYLLATNLVSSFSLFDVMCSLPFASCPSWRNCMWTQIKLILMDFHLVWENCPTWLSLWRQIIIWSLFQRGCAGENWHSLLVVRYNYETNIYPIENGNNMWLFDFAQVWKVKEAGLEQKPTCDITRGHPFSYWPGGKVSWLKK